MIHDEIDCASKIDNHLREIAQLVCVNNVSKYVVVQDLIFFLDSAQTHLNLSKKKVEK